MLIAVLYPKYILLYIKSQSSINFEGYLNFSILGI